MAANDTVEIVASYSDGAFDNSLTPAAGINFNVWMSTPASRTNHINKCVAKGVNLIFMGNSNSCNGAGSTTYGTTWTPIITGFIQACTAAGIQVGQIGGPGTGPADRVKTFNLIDPAVQIKFFLLEKEYWNGNGTYAQFQGDCIAISTLLHPVNVDVGAYLANWQVGEMGGLVNKIDTFWLTQYTNRPEYKRSGAAGSISFAVNEIAGTNPVTPVRVGALISLESYEFNATGSNSNNNNFLGNWIRGARITTGTNPSPLVAAQKNFQQLFDVYTHKGLPNTPNPKHFNAEPINIQNKIHWVGGLAYSWCFWGQLTFLDKRTDNICYSIGDGADGTQVSISTNVARQVPLTCGAFWYLGDIYGSGSGAQYTNQYDLYYGTKAVSSGGVHRSLTISTAATLGNHEWPNRANAYSAGGSDAYWNGQLVSQGGMAAEWEGDRTQTSPRWFSYTRFGWKIIVIGTMEDGHAGGGMTAGSAGHTWLVNELSSAGNKKIVLGHHPRWSEGSGHGDNPSMQPAWAAMQGHALVYMAGHDHNFQIQKMRDTNGNVVTSGGIHQVVNGCGGTGNSGFAGSGMSLFRTTNYGGAKITLGTNSLEICHFDQNGVISGCTTLLANAVNTPPVVNAGPDQSIVLPSTAAMNATVTDDGLLLAPTYTWSQISGPGVSVFAPNANALNPTVTFPTAGTYVLQLSVFDGQFTVTDTVTIIVGALPVHKNIIVQSQNPNAGVPIVVSAADINALQNGNTQFARIYNSAQALTLQAPPTFAGNTFVRWLRDGVVFSTGTPITTISILDTASHTFTAVYNTGLANTAPVVNAGLDQTITLPSNAIMAATVTDDGLLLPVTYAWTQISGPGAASFSPSTVVLNPTVAFSAPGVYVLQLCANDGQYTICDSVQITVNASPAQKTYIINSQTPNSGVAVTINIADINGLQNGATTFSRTYIATASVTITAPLSSGGNTFVKWLRDGINFSTQRIITITDTSNHTFTAVYAPITPNQWPVYVTSANPAAGIQVICSGMTDGITPFSNLVNDGSIVIMSAQATAGGRIFQYWKQDGLTTVSTSPDITVVISAPVTYTAVYAPLPNEVTIVPYLYNADIATYFSDAVIAAKIYGGTANYSGTCLTSSVTLVGTYPAQAITDVLIDSSGFAEWDQLYTFTVLDSLGRTGSSQILLIRPAIPLARIAVIQATPCVTTGQITIEYPGDPINSAGFFLQGGGVFGAPAYTKTAADTAGAGATTQVRTGLAAGAYQETIMDDATSIGAVADQHVVESADLNNQVTNGDLQVTPGGTWVLAGGAAYNATLHTVDVPVGGTIAITVTTEVGKYYHGGLWFSGAGGVLNFALDGGADLTIAGPGTLEYNLFPSAVPGLYGFVATATSHVVHIKSDGAWSGKVYKVLIQEYDILFDATIAVPSSVSYNGGIIHHISCNGGGNGSIIVFSLGGTGAYHYVWTKTGSPGLTFPDLDTISNLYPGTYNVTVSDGCGSYTHTGFLVTEPAAIATTPAVTNVTGNGLSNGSVSFSSTGGSSPYHYFVDGVAIPSNILGGLSAGTHSYQTFDNVGCSIIGTFVVTQPDSLLGVNITPTSPLCYGNLGSVSALAAGGTGPYKYALDGAGYGSFIASPTPFTASSLAPGTHSLAILDTAGNTTTSTFVIASPGHIIHSETAYPISASGLTDGHIVVNVSGSVFPMTIVWGDGTTFTLNAAGSIDYTQLAAGNYTATITDAHACTATLNATVAGVTLVNEESPDPPDNFYKRISCCLADKAWEFFKLMGHGHSDIECKAYPLMAAIRMLKILRRWYPLGTTVSTGEKGYFVFYIDDVGVTPNVRFTFSMIGKTNVIVTFTSNPSGSVNAIIYTALSGAGWDVYYDDVTDYLWVYSPRNDWYNNLAVTIVTSNPNDHLPQTASHINYVTNKFMGACSPCASDALLESQCLTEAERNSMIEQLKAYCATCLSCNCEEVVTDNGSK